MIAVIGGAGFIGSNLCSQLIEMGHDVLCVDNLITGSIKNISNLNLRFVNIDVAECPLVSQGINIKNITEIYYLASIASPKLYLKYPLETIDANVAGFRNILQLALDVGAKILYASTSEVYGDPKVNVQREDYFGNVSTVGTRSVYDESKRLGETLSVTYHRKYSVDTKIARMFNTYGPGMLLNDGRVIPEFINKCMKNEDMEIYGNGHQTRSFCHVSDMIHGLINLMNSNYNMPVNLGNPNEYISIISLARRIRNMMDSTSNIVFKGFPSDHDPIVCRPDISLASKILNFIPLVTLEKGLENTIDYFRKVVKWDG